MKKVFWLYFGAFLIGLAVLAWPEENNLMMVQLSEKHGPSQTDLAGIVIMITGYLPMIWQVAKTWGRIKNRLGQTIYVLVTLIAIAQVMIAWSLYANNESILWISVGLSLTQVVLIYYAFKMEVVNHDRASRR